MSTIVKNLLNSNTSSVCPDNTNFGPIAAEIGLPVWGTAANFNGFRVIAALLHGTLVVGVSQTLRRWTQGATYVRQGGHNVGAWPTFSFDKYHFADHFTGRAEQSSSCVRVSIAVFYIHNHTPVVVDLLAYTDWLYLVASRDC